ncbi:MAG: hypothetical protein HY447_01970 [Candidatus Omnitrophica bacterium]|nr:hypothetical protein [Candidatus Omnitrophota bacterium]
MIKRLLFGVSFVLLMWLPVRLYALLQGNQILLVDRFDNQSKVNLLGGENRGEGAQFALGEEAFGKRGASLSFEYDVTEPDASSYYLFKLGVQNLSKMGYLSFWMKDIKANDASKSEFLVELYEDTDGDGKYVYGKDSMDRVPISRFKAGGEIDEWRKIVIPLTRFQKIQHWDRTLEMTIVFEQKWGSGKGKLLFDDLLFGSNYPEGFNGKEITMQNRVSSFKIGGRVASPEMKVKSGKIPITLTLTFIDPYLEEIRFEESLDEGKSWRCIQSFYDHSTGGIYTTNWSWPHNLGRDNNKVTLRAIGSSVRGGETELGGPYGINLG